MYTYCANNPVIYVDPSGHFALELFAVGLAATAAFSFASAALSQPQVQSDLAKASNALTSGIDSLIDSVASGINDAVESLSSSQRHGVKENFTSTCQDPYLAPWIDGSLSLEENWAKNWKTSDVTKDDADSIGKTIDIPILPMKKPVFFPKDPLKFYPFFMQRYNYDTPNGKIYKWGYTEKQIYFEWDEDLENGEHYHCVLPSWKNHSESGRKKDVIHYYAGEPVPEPWATFYRGK